MEKLSLVTGIAAMVFAALLAFTCTPLVRVLAYKIGAIDVPKDERRMHKVPMPRLGGLAIFAGFVAATALFCEYSPVLLALWFGGLMIVVLGILDDVFRLSPIVKFAAQIAASLVPVGLGLTIDFISLGGEYLELGVFSIPVTVVWIVGLTNAINLIDGLDGLSCGVSAICSLSLLLVVLTLDPVPEVALPLAILAGSCLGFLPFNTNPAKIFMGDTGALFLGYTLSLLAIDGVFKVHAVVSFMIPLSIFGLPLFDTVFAFLRRVSHGKNPFKPDRGHLHHRLMDMGFNQRQSVGILYAVCGILGISAVMFTYENLAKAAIIIVIGIVIFLANFLIFKNPKTREQSGIDISKHACSDADKSANAPAPPSGGTSAPDAASPDTQTGDGGDSVNEHKAATGVR